MPCVNQILRYYKLCCRLLGCAILIRQLLLGLLLGGWPRLRGDGNRALGRRFIIIIVVLSNMHQVHCKLIICLLLCSGSIRSVSMSFYRV